VSMIKLLRIMLQADPVPPDYKPFAGRSTAPPSTSAPGSSSHTSEGFPVRWEHERDAPAIAPIPRRCGALKRSPKSRRQSVIERIERPVAAG